MEFKTLILKREEGIATIILNRPERLNAINSEMISELNHALEEVARDEQVRVVILTGAGRAFSAGADLKEVESLSEVTPEDKRRHLEGGAQEVVRRLQRMGKPTIAMVNGAAAGAGFDWALACDIRIGAETARFRAAYTIIGLIPGAGATWLLSRIVGPNRTAEIIFTGDFVEAKEAERIGILNRIFPVEELEKETMALARRIASNPPIALRLDKQLLYKGLEVDLDTALGMAAAFQTICLASEDHKEAVAAFKEKRQPLFKGR
jgi:2-(1,2-epoxy-1,2-dihydrophenyl)acetyl-CoA isomerase